MIGKTVCTIMIQYVTALDKLVRNTYHYNNLEITQNRPKEWRHLPRLEMMVLWTSGPAKATTTTDEVVRAGKP